MQGGGDPREDGAAPPPSLCVPPPYDPLGDSFLVGSLRLFGPAGEFHREGPPQERAARLAVPGGEDSASRDRYWDVYHNVLPAGAFLVRILYRRTDVGPNDDCKYHRSRNLRTQMNTNFTSTPLAHCSLSLSPDPRGHYLILFALDNKLGGWRDQTLLPNDCRNVTYLASTADPPGSVILSYNSVGAGASQNHIHCHAWVCPPPHCCRRRGVPAGATSNDGRCGFTHRPHGGYEGVLPGLPVHVHPVVGVVGHDVRRHGNPPPSSPSRP